MNHKLQNKYYAGLECKDAIADDDSIYKGYS